MKLVKMARAFFESFGIKIYVDWADHTMPKTTCGETATITIHSFMISSEIGTMFCTVS